MQLTGTSNFVCGGNKMNALKAAERFISEILNKISNFFVLIQYIHTFRLASRIKG